MAFQGGAIALLAQAPAEPDLTASPPGWVLTPTFGIGGSWNSNVTLAGRAAEHFEDAVGQLDPSLRLDYLGRATRFSLRYNGDLRAYRDLQELNAVEHHGRLDWSYRPTRRLTLFMQDGFSKAPTTETVMLAGVPFLYTGATTNTARAGMEAMLSRRTTLSTTYEFQVHEFEEPDVGSMFVNGGRSHDISAEFRYRTTARSAVGLDYQIRRAHIDGTGQRFDIQHGEVAFDYTFSPYLELAVAAGVARLEETVLGSSRTGPAWRVQLSRRTPHATLDFSYSQSFVPSFGFGGTMENQDVSGRIRIPFARNRLYWNAGVSWQQNDPLTAGELSLRSLWSDTSFGYVLRRWLRVEAFYSHVSQDSQRAGGHIDRDLVGVQIVTSKPMRIR
jgi:hypothetical protein